MKKCFQQDFKNRKVSFSEKKQEGRVHIRKGPSSHFMDMYRCESTMDMLKVRMDGGGQKKEEKKPKILALELFDFNVFF